MKEPERDPVRWWNGLTSPEVQALDTSGVVAVLPVAAVEQHGPHLPLSTDLDIGLGLLAEAFRTVDDAVHAVALPPQSLGTSLEHEGLPATLGLPPGLLEETLVELGASVAQSGIRRLVISNSHRGNKAAIDHAGLRLRKDLGLLVVKASYFRFPRPVGLELPEAEWAHGLHGGAVETAMMLHLQPGRVRLDEMRDFPSLGSALGASLAHVRPEGYASFAWLATDLNPQGVTGDALLASAEMGSTLVRHYGSILAGIIEDAARFPLDRLSGDGDED